VIVQVAIDLSLDRLFTYRVPEEQEKKLAVGQLLSVPFGHREARGFAISTSADDAAGGDLRLKPVSAIVDEVPFFTAGLMTLVAKLAKYTASPIEAMLRAAVPAAVLKKGARAKEQLFVEPALAAEPVTLTKRQQWLYDQIARLGGGWMQQLCRELETTPSTIRQLGEKGLVTVASRQRRRDPLAGGRLIPTKPLKLNDEQAKALEIITKSDGPRTTLLHGVTGSGKTEVYLQAIGRELEAGRGAIVMVPEISLTPQTVKRFASRFGKVVAVLHSALSDGERFDEWHRIRSGEARVVVGPRSAVFAPVRDLGLIVVDEEHDPSYKQDEMPRYNARDAAVLRGEIEGARVVLGSATPSLETWLNAKTGKYAVATMKSRAGAGTLPYVKAVNMSEANAGIFSQELLEAIRARLDRGEQTILFLNRRGYSRSVVCGDCGHVVKCPKCELAYTYHQADDCLRCHICGGWIPTPQACPVCKKRELSYKGIGTQRAELALQKCFPRAGILRMDADSTSRKNSHDDILASFGRREADILIGTQMIAKGLDFPNVTLVGVLNADSSLNMPDFRASERTYQLLAQVSGRAGRAALPGEVFIQSHDPAVMPIQMAVRGSYEEFAAAELRDREEAEFPPFCHLSTVNFRSENLKTVSDWAEMYAKALSTVKGLDAGEACPSALEKADGWFRWQIVLRSKSAATILKAYRWITAERPPPKALRLYLDMDAISVV